MTTGDVPPPYNMHDSQQRACDQYERRLNEFYGAKISSEEKRHAIGLLAKAQYSEAIDRPPQFDDFTPSDRFHLWGDLDFLD